MASLNVLIISAGINQFLHNSKKTKVKGLLTASDIKKHEKKQEMNKITRSLEKILN